MINNSKKIWSQSFFLF